MEADLTTTARLRLARPGPDDLDDLHAMLSDPAVWEHFPSLRHTERATTEESLAKGVEAWERDGLGWWVARRADGPGGGDGGRPGGPIAGDLVGNGGCTLRLGVAWNLGYRLVPSAWGHGYAQEIIAAGRAAAAARRPDLPVTAYLLEHNVGSRRSVERAGGLTLVRRGPDAGNPDPDAVRLLYADRPLDTETLEVLTAAL